MRTLGTLANPPWALLDLHTDHLGTVRLITDASGTVVSEHKYFPFGEPTVAEAPGDNTHKYTGHERDGESGLDYMLARYYSPSLGRFLSKDPINGFAEDPQSWNRYAYVRNNPLIIRDPTGEFWDYVADAIGIGYDLYNLWNEPSWGNAGTLLADIGLGAIPFIPNTGAARLGLKLLSRGDDVADVIKGARSAGVSEDILETGGKWLKQWDTGQGVIKAENGDIILTGVKLGGDGRSATRWYKRVGPDGQTKTLWHDNYKDGKFTGRKHKDVEGQDVKESEFPEPSKGSTEGGPNQTVLDPQTGQKGSCGYLCR